VKADQNILKPFWVSPEYAVNIVINNAHIDHVQGDNGKVIIFYLIILIYGMDKKGKVIRIGRIFVFDGQVFKDLIGCFHDI
jgi:hypothetical protein